MEHILQVYFPQVLKSLLSWASETDVTFIIGCIVTLLLSVFSMALPKIRKSIERILFSYD